MKVSKIVAFLVTAIAFMVDGFQRADNARSTCFSVYSVDKKCSDSNFPRAQSLFPIGKTVLPPFIMHVAAEQPFPSVSKFLVQDSALPLSYIKELIAFGAVYFRLGENSKLKRLSPDYNSIVPIGSYARIHVNPRRYPQFYLPDFNRCIIDQSLRDGSLVVIDKPPGAISLVPTVDNIVENVIAAVETVVYGNSMREACKLHACGRLDSCTSGVCVFAKNAESAKVMNDALKSRSVKKIYRALCVVSPYRRASLPTGTVEHLFRRKSVSHSNAKPTLLKAFDPALLQPAGHGADLSVAAPKSKSRATKSQDNTWQAAKLVILNSRTLTLKLPSESAPLNCFEVEIELVTGRTHQIRLQMSALGFPLYGDTRYIPVSGLLDDEETGDGADLFGPDPKSSIGLHCQSLEFPANVVGIEGRDKVEFRSSEPWWCEFEEK